MDPLCRHTIYMHTCTCTSYFAFVWVHPLPCMKPWYFSATSLYLVRRLVKLNHIHKITQYKSSISGVPMTGMCLQSGWTYNVHALPTYYCHKLHILQAHIHVHVVLQSWHTCQSIPLYCYARYITVTRICHHPLSCCIQMYIQSLFP